MLPFLQMQGKTPHQQQITAHFIAILALLGWSVVSLQYLQGLYLIEDLQDLYAKNDKMLIRETAEDLNKWGNILCSQMVDSPQTDIPV